MYKDPFQEIKKSHQLFSDIIDKILDKIFDSTDVKPRSNIPIPRYTKSKRHSIDGDFFNSELENRLLKLTIKNCILTTNNEIWYLRTLFKDVDFLKLELVFENIEFQNDPPSFAPELLKLSFNNCKLGNMSLAYIRNGIELKLENCEFNTISFFSFKGSISLKNISGVAVNFAECNISNLNLSDTIDAILMLGDNLYEITRIAKLTFTRSCVIDILNITNCNIGVAGFYGKQQSSSAISIENCTIEFLLFENFISLGLFRLSNVSFRTFGYDLDFRSVNKPNYNLEIKNCHFNDLNLFTTNIKSFPLIRISNTDLSKVRFIDSKFPIEKLKSEKSTLSESKKILEDLSLAALNQNDRYLYFEYFKESRNIELEYLLSKNENLSSRLSLQVSKLYSEHGTNWVRAISITLFLIAPICFLILMSFTNYPVEITKLESYSRFFSFYAQFITPIHKLNFIGDYSQNGGFVMTDIASRILIGIGIYETIKSFRKYSRK